MTENEAIKDLKDSNERCLRICESACSNIENNQCNCSDGVIKRMLDELLQYRAIGTLEEVKNHKHNLSISYKIISDYEAIGTVEECREAVEKQKPKKIIIRNWNPTKCPTCGHELSTSLGDGYYKHPTFLERCPNCGQVIQWEENLEGMEDERD